MTTKVIGGIEYLAVPSAICCSLSGGIQCSQFNSPVDCASLKCAVPGQHVCFITQAQFPEWLKAKLIGDTDATQ